MTHSSDGGETWSAPQVAPGYDWHGVECAGLTALADGRVLLNQWRFRWYPLDAARRRAATETLSLPSAWGGALASSSELDSGAALAGHAEALAPWARGGGDAYVHLSTDGGRSFEETTRLDTAPFIGGYGMRGVAGDRRRLGPAPALAAIARGDLPEAAADILAQQHKNAAVGQSERRRLLELVAVER